MEYRGLPDDLLRHHAEPQGNPDSATSLGKGAAGVVLPNGNFVLFL